LIKDNEIGQRELVRQLSDTGVSLKAESKMQEKAEAPNELGSVLRRSAVLPLAGAFLYQVDEEAEATKGTELEGFRRAKPRFDDALAKVQARALMLHSGIHGQLEASSKQAQRE
jgi:hypothetical protein